MAHDLEILENGEASMAYAYKNEEDTPWHSLGVRVSSDLTPEQMMQAAGLDWKVKTKTCFTMIDDKRVRIGKQALIRESDNKILDIISDDWNPCQNEEAFEFFNDFIAAGDMEMNTAGSLNGGRTVWAMAKTKEGFSLFGGKDHIEQYLLFTNPHSYGRSIDVRMTATRVVCQNTLAMSLNSKSSRMVKVNHRKAFNGDVVKEKLGIAKEKIQKYKEMAEYLSTKRYTDENIVEYFKRVFPASGHKEISRNATYALEHAINEQPGAEYGEGTWWGALNTVTYMTNWTLGRNADTRLQSTWYGSNNEINHRALDLAVEMAG